MTNLLAFPVLILAVILQTAVVSRLPLLHGTADIVLLILVAWCTQERVKNGWFWVVIGGILTSFVSALPYYLPLISYLIVAGMIWILQRRVWQSPLLALFTATVAGTLVTQVMSFVALVFNGTPLAWNESLTLVILPSILLNLIFSLPVYAVISDLAAAVFPQEID